MDWGAIGKVLNLVCSALTVGFATFATSGSIEGAVVAGAGSAVNHLRENPITPTPKKRPAIRPNVYQIVGILMILSVLFPVMGNAHTTATWTRNTETDVDHYTGYYCVPKGCVLDKATATKTPNIPQTAVGVAPTLTLPFVEGTLGVTATDTSQNESPMSNTIPFDQAPPKAVNGLNVK